jgi:hemerythrin-like domain-containing protein
MDNRRDFLRKTGMLSAWTLMIGAPVLAQSKKAEGKEEGQISPAEDLMREHGVLNRILLVYEEIGCRIRDKQTVDPALLGKSADMISRFIEQYHEKLEENHLFPRFQKANMLTDLVKTLLAQHIAGRGVTATIQQVAKSGLKTDAERQQALQSMHEFIRMYRPHETREDTVLFPALHKLVSPHEYGAMGEEFERIEHKTFGGDGFDMAVDQVAEIEKALGIYDLSQFTPK